MTPIGILFAVIISFLCGCIFTPFVRGIALRWNICEKPNGRTSRDIAHIGGVAIIAAILFTLIPVFLFLLPDNPLHKAFLPVFIASGFLIFLLGIIDDLRSLHYFYKLFLQIAVSIFVAACGLALLDHFGVMSLSLPAALVTFAGVALWMLSITTLRVVTESSTTRTVGMVSPPNRPSLQSVRVTVDGSQESSAAIRDRRTTMSMRRFMRLPCGVLFDTSGL